MSWADRFASASGCHVAASRSIHTHHYATEFFMTQIHPQVSRQSRARHSADKLGRQEFLEDILSGLRLPQKRLPSKYLYDERGSRLFSKICEAPEYYPTRTELSIMRRHAGQMVELIGPQCLVIEFGCGSAAKIRILLDRLETPTAYVPVDVSYEQLRQTSASLAGNYPDLEVLPLCADFCGRLELPKCAGHVARRMVYFPGSTIGNFDPAEMKMLLEKIAVLCGSGGGLLIGVDLPKDVVTLEAAYNDRNGVTAEFNLNLLERINRQLGGGFQLDRFEHRAIYNERQGRIEMHLASLGDQTVMLDGEQFTLAKDESICTEHSYKYKLDEFQRLAAGAGLRPCRHWTDEERLFSVQFLLVP